MINYLLNGNDIIHLTIGLIKKKYCCVKMSYFSPYSKNKIGVKSDFSNYATKSDQKTRKVLIHHNLLKKRVSYLNTRGWWLDIDKLEKVPSGLGLLKSKLDKLDVNDLSAVLEYLSKLSHVVKNEVAEKADYNAKIKDIGDTTAADLNAKIEEVKGEIPSIANFVATTTLTTVENKIPDYSKYITSHKFIKLTTEMFTAKLKQANLVTEDDIAEFLKETPNKGI